MKTSFKKLSIYFLIIYFLISLPITSMFVFNEYFRFQFYQLVTHYYSKIHDINIVFIGDSITAGGRNWLNVNKAGIGNAMNLAGNGYTTKQIIYQALEARKFNPDYICVMSGTNDVLNVKDSTTTVFQFEQEYLKLMDILSKKSRQTIIITLIPYQQNKNNSNVIDAMNSVIIEIAQSRKIKYIDLNPRISKEKTILPEFTVDGTHFTPEAYKIWIDLLNQQIE